MNQNLLIVDDEIEILSGLAELFKYDFDMDISVYTASSAMDAIKLLVKVRFDVVLTDIRMPGMDGITLFKQIKENWPRCKVVFLTGYRNFEDVYQIINNQDVQYILKSEDDDVIMNAIRNALTMRRKELEQEMHKNQQDKWLEEAKYWLKREFMNQLCSGTIGEADMNDKMQALSIPLDAENEVLLFLLRIEKQRNDELTQQNYLPVEALAGVLQENVPLKLCFYVHIIDMELQLLLVQPLDYNNVNWQMIDVISQGAIEYAQERFRILYQATFSAVDSTNPIKFSEISSQLKKMKKFMVGYIGGAREVILKMSIMESQVTEEQIQNTSGWVVSLKNLLETRKREEYFTVLNKYLRGMTERSSRHDTIALEIYYNISILLLQFINENHLKEHLAFKIGIYKLTMAIEHTDWMEAAKYLSDISAEIFSLLDTNETTLANHALKRVIEYIENHLDQELTLTHLAEVGGFNASYLSRLFKQVQKENLTDFILHKRIGLAKELLVNTNVKIQDIAAKTGYLSAHSFTRAFRSVEGISPTEYRELKKGPL